MTTVAGFLSIAGAALTTVGALTKNSDLSKIGGYMSIAGGIGTAYNAATSATAASAAETAAQNSSDAFFQAEAATQSSVPLTATSGADAASTAVQAQAAQSAAPEISNSIVDGFNYEAPANTLLNTAAERTATAPTTIPTDIATPSQLTAPSDPVAAGAQRMTTQQVNSFLKTAQDKAAAAAKGLGSFVKDNKELVQLGGGILKSMYGPEAESLNMRQSIYERQRANMNSPVRLGIVKPQ